MAPLYVFTRKSSSVFGYASNRRMRAKNPLSAMAASLTARREKSRATWQTCRACRAFLDPAHCFRAQTRPLACTARHSATSAPTPPRSRCLRPAGPGTLLFLKGGGGRGAGVREAEELSLLGLGRSPPRPAVAFGLGERAINSHSCEGASRSESERWASPWTVRRWICGRGTCRRMLGGTGTTSRGSRESASRGGTQWNSSWLRDTRPRRQTPSPSPRGCSPRASSCLV